MGKKRKGDQRNLWVIISKQKTQRRKKIFSFAAPQQQQPLQNTDASSAALSADPERRDSGKAEVSSSRLKVYTKRKKKNVFSSFLYTIYFLIRKSGSKRERKKRTNEKRNEFIIHSLREKERWRIYKPSPFYRERRRDAGQ
jgi:hypothetical protein